MSRVCTVCAHEERHSIDKALLGDLDDRPVVNVLVSPEWQQVRAQILAALDPYPEARFAVAGALQC